MVALSRLESGLWYHLAREHANYRPLWLNSWLTWRPRGPQIVDFAHLRSQDGQLSTAPVSIGSGIFQRPTALAPLRGGKGSRARRALGPQISADAEHLVAAWNARGAHADAVLADIRRRHHGTALVPVGPLPGLSDRERRRPPRARPSSRRGGDEPYSVAVVPIMPAARALCRTCPLVAGEHRRLDARGAPAGACPSLLE